VDIDGRGLSKKAVYRGEIKIFSPVVHGRAAEDDLGDVFRTDEIGHGIGDAAPTQANNLGAQVLREA